MRRLVGRKPAVADARATASARGIHASSPVHRNRHTHRPAVRAAGDFASAREPSLGDRARSPSILVSAGMLPLRNRFELSGTVGPRGKLVVGILSRVRRGAGIGYIRLRRPAGRPEADATGPGRPGRADPEPRIPARVSAGPRPGQPGQPRRRSAATRRPCRPPRGGHGPRTVVVAGVAQGLDGLGVAPCDAAGRPGILVLRADARTIRSPSTRGWPARPTASRTARPSPAGSTRRCQCRRRRWPPMR